MQAKIAILQWHGRVSLQQFYSCVIYLRNKLGYSFRFLVCLRRVIASLLIIVFITCNECIIERETKLLLKRKLFHFLLPENLSDFPRSIVAVLQVM